MRTVLVVDHDPEFRCGLENALGPLGYGLVQRRRRSRSIRWIWRARS